MQTVDINRCKTESQYAQALAKIVADSGEGVERRWGRLEMEPWAARWRDAEPGRLGSLVTRATNDAQASHARFEAVCLQ